MVIYVHLIKRKTRMSPTGGLHFQNISFRIGNQQRQDTVNMQDTLNNVEET